MEIVKASFHSHSSIGSHGSNINHESDITTRDKVTIPIEKNYVEGTSDHDSTVAHNDIAETIESRGLGEHPHIYQIEVSTPGHIIFSAPREVIGGFEHRYKISKMLEANKKLLKIGDYDGVTTNILELIDKAVNGNDKMVVGAPHMVDSLKSGIIAKYPIEESLKILRSKNVHYLEAFNGMNSDHGNLCNASLAILMKELYGKGIMVGADSHWTKMLGTNLNLLEVDEFTEDAILKSARDDRVVGFENLQTTNLQDTRDWALNRIRVSQYDMIMKTYNGSWTKDSSFSSLAKVPPFPTLLRATINYAVKKPDSKVWDMLTNLAVGVNRLYEIFQMTPKYKKFVEKMTDGRVNSYGPLDYREFRKDPLKAMEQIAVVPSLNNRAYVC